VAISSTGEVFLQARALDQAPPIPFDIKLRYSDGVVRPLLKGTMTAGEGVTQATA